MSRNIMTRQELEALNRQHEKERIEKVAAVDKAMDEWVNKQAKKRTPMRHIGWLIVLILLVYYAVMYVWK